MTEPDFVVAARIIAHVAHLDQVDKAGEPYVGHLRRVAERVHSPEEKATAWLHDVLEDTPVTAEHLLAEGIPAVVVDAVKALTHAPHERRIKYYARVVGNEIAWKVKLADVEDNSDPARLACLDEVTRARLEKKYDEARAALQ